MNPYEHWLGIQNPDRVPNYFQLLGISYKETDASVIKAAALKQLAKLKPHKEGKNSAVCLQLEKRIRKAFKVLSDQNLRADYVGKLKQQSAASSKVAASQPALQQAPVPVAQYSETAQPVSMANEPELAKAGISKWVVIGAAVLGGAMLLAIGGLGAALFFSQGDSQVADNRSQNKPEQTARQSSEPSNTQAIESDVQSTQPSETPVTTAPVEAAEPENEITVETTATDVAPTGSSTRETQFDRADSGSATTADLSQTDSPTQSSPDPFNIVPSPHKQPARTLGHR